MVFWKRGWVPILASIVLVWVSLVPLPVLPDLKFIPVDKVGHLVAFLALALLYLWAFDHQSDTRKSKFSSYWITFLLTAFIGGLIELLQHFLPVNRVGDWYDFYFDIAGIIIAIIIYPMLKQKILNKIGLILLVFVVLNVTGQNAYQDALNYQNELTEEFANAETSPLDSVDQVKFKALRFFPIDTTFRVSAK